MDARVTADEMSAFRRLSGAEEFDEWPDEAVQRLALFQWWLFSERLRALGRTVLDALPFRFR